MTDGNAFSFGTAQCKSRLTNANHQGVGAGQAACHHLDRLAWQKTDLLQPSGPFRSMAGCVDAKHHKCLTNLGLREAGWGSSLHG